MANIIYKETTSKPKQTLKKYGIWSDSPLDANTYNESVLTSTGMNLHTDETSSLEGNYYYNIYSEPSATNLNAPLQFSLAFGTLSPIKFQSSDVDYEYTYPSYAVYRQFANILLNEGSNKNFTYKSASKDTTIEAAYFVSIARDRLRFSMDKDSFQLNISSSYNSSYSNSTVGNIIISSSKTDTSPFLMTLGTSSGYTGVIGSSSLFGHPVGLAFPEYGVLVLDAYAITNLIGSASAFNILNYMTGSATSSYSAKIPLDNIYNLIYKGNYFQARSAEIVNSTYYYCKAGIDDFNYSTNPTWISGSTNEILPSLVNDKKTYISGIGLYDDDHRLIATAKLSRPLEKDDTKELNISIRLDF